MIIDASHGSPLIKPPLWAIDPGIVAYNASRLGLPMPVGLWAMWEGSGDRTCDLSGNGSDGTLLNGASWQGGGIYLAGTNDQIVVSGVARFIDLDKDFTVMLCFSVPSTPGVTAKIFTIERVGSDWPFVTISMSSVGKLIVEAKNDNNVQKYYLETASRFDDTSEHTLVFAKSNSACRLYVDGKFQVENTTVGIGDYSAPDRARFGVWRADISDLTGSIYNSCIHDQYLNPSQAITLSADPYGLVRQPRMEELWAYVAAGGVAPTGAFYGPLVGPMGGPI